VVGRVLLAFSWGSVFVINMPLVVVAVSLGVVVLPESTKPGAGALTPPALPCRLRGSGR
jgi:MFS transporter, DHA2 family, multidrug resistance protein